MKITFICAVFPPEPEPAGSMAEQLAMRLASDEAGVRMVVPFPNRPRGRIYPGFRRRLLGTVKNAGQYQIAYCANWLLDQKRRPIHRLLENFTFGLTSVWAVWRMGSPDVLIVETWPLIAATCAALWAFLFHIPFVYYVQDVYPEALEFSGHIRINGRLANLLRAWDRKICMRSSRVVAISEGSKKLLCDSRGVPADKIRVIPNWLDASLFPAYPRNNEWRRRLGILDSQFLVLFAGTMGHVSGAQIILDVARHLKENGNIQMLCVGEGVLKEHMARTAAAEGLTNIQFKPFQPREEVPRMHAAADATLLTVRGGYSDASVPSKLITYLAAGRPVICAAPEASSAAKTVCEADAGEWVEPGDARAIADAILRLSIDPEATTRMGMNARAFFMEHFTFERAYKQFQELLSQVVSNRSGLETTPDAREISSHA